MKNEKKSIQKKKKKQKKSKGKNTKKIKKLKTSKTFAYQHCLMTKIGKTSLLEGEDYLSSVDTT